MDGLVEGWIGRGMGWERDGLGEGWVGRGMDWEKDYWGIELIILPFKIVVMFLYIHLHCTITANSGSFLKYRSDFQAVSESSTVHIHRLYEAIRDNPPNESAPSRENLVIGNCTLHTVV